MISISPSASLVKNGGEIHHAPLSLVKGGRRISQSPFLVKNGSDFHQVPLWWKRGRNSPVIFRNRLFRNAIFTDMRICMMIFVNWFHNYFYYDYHYRGRETIRQWDDGSTCTLVRRQRMGGALWIWNIIIGEDKGESKIGSSRFPIVTLSNLESALL